MLLLVPGDYLNEGGGGDEHDDHCRVSIAGGQPILYDPDRSPIVCPRCSSATDLLAQVYAPLPDADRTVYVLACSARSCRQIIAKVFCSSTSSPWPEPEPEPVPVIAADDDWGLDDDDDDLAGLDQLLDRVNVAPPKPPTKSSNNGSRFYLIEVDEPDKGRVDLSHERDLLSRYESGSADRQTDEQHEPERYEVMGDSHFLKFQKRLSRKIQQCVRYDFGGEPLWARASVPPSIPPCPTCRQTKVFELQLMPNLINCLRLDDDHDWVTVAVYVCPTSCVRDRLIDEYTFTQDGF